ncbi:SIR2 family protein [Kitasatospora sp. NPDC085879]|uniref:SIR2 family protein n=1 Tax=Kitasatospora sp. NPDC085879 TaxID=3154769 RepID=UPI003428985E
MCSAEFEFGLIWDKDQEAFDTSLRYADAETTDWPCHPSQPLRIDIDVLKQHVRDDDEYSRRLTEMVFGSSGEVVDFFGKAIAAARQTPVHFRIHIDGPDRFHSVRWELLRTPSGDLPIATSGNILLSRYLANANWSALPPLPPHDMKALIAVASPGNISQYAPRGKPLAQLDIDREVGHAQLAISPYNTVVLSGKGKVTLEAIMRRIDNVEDPLDILYLVCHGAQFEDVPGLYLEDPEGKVDKVDARRLAERIAGLERKPTLVVLISCQSAGVGENSSSDDGGVLAALGPRLAGAGVGAVVAMQGNITTASADLFTPAFFKKLSEGGAVDGAMAVGRNAIRHRPDWWVPVLFSRLRSGRAYHAHTRTGGPANTWQALPVMIKTNRFTPVLGPGLADGILGSRHEIARRWVRRWQMPIAPHVQGNLTQVAQYLRVTQSPDLVNAYLQDYLKTELQERKEKAVGSDPFTSISSPIDTEPERAILEVGRKLRQADESDPYRVLASLPVKLYVTTGWTDLLQDALRESQPKRTPVTLCFPWTELAEWENPSKPDAPSLASPWVYHLFGRLDIPDSIVLTEDDYFAWLTAWIDKRPDIPSAVGKSLTGRSLMFLGYRLDDWDFRVVFQSIKSFLGYSRMSRSNHVGVQLRPENEMIEPEAAQRYLQSYFRDDHVNIFWTTPRDFLGNLRSRIEGPS